MATRERLGRYTLAEVIGVGGFATVYRATDGRLGGDVAVKVLAENRSLDPDVRERFIQEGRRLRRLHSPHVVAVHDLGETPDARPYLVLEWADRGDLARRVAEARAAGRVPGPADVLVVARALAAALGDLHAHGIVHRDLAPGNLLLRSTAAGDGVAGGLIAPDERVLLADLGLSKDLAAASGLTAGGGTAGFTPPEQRTPGTVDQRADVWAASALLVWLGSGRGPDDTGTWRESLRAAGWPPAVAAVLARGLSTRPDDRHPDMAAWFAAVEAAAEPAPAPASPEAGAAGAAWRRAFVVGLLALLVGAGLGAGGAALLAPGPDVRREDLGDGRVRTVVSDDGVTITVEGPEEAAVGAPVVLDASIQGATSWVWVGPDGVVSTGADTFEVRAASTGAATVRLLAVDAEGEVVTATRDLRFSDD